MAGTVLGGRYQVQDKIGTGGMATVFRGTDEVLGRTVAIKTMLPQYATDPSFAARFKQEAQAAAALQSPYIVSVYDWGKDADTYYIVMEYLRGTDLKSGIRKHGALDCKKVAQIGSQIAQALSVAHKHDIIHRDIKPQNIMVQPDGNIKVMDFGIARAKNSHLTTDNSVLGTAHYVSPEQTQGKELGPTTDIYSLGIVMYEAATGQVPFQGDDAISVALKQVNEQPKPPSQLNPAIDPSLESIILKCMQKDPAARFQTANELYHTLRDYLAGRMQAVNNATAVLGAAPTAVMGNAATGVMPAGRASATSTMPRVGRVSTESTGRVRPQTATELAAEQEAERDRKKKHKLIGGIVAAIVVLAAAAFVFFNLVGSGTQVATVPNLLKLDQETAQATIEASGFDVGDVTSAFDDTVEEGLVCDQDPSPTTSMPEGTKINIVISKGAQPAAEVEVPDLTGKTGAEATELLRQYNLLGKQGDDVESSDVDSGLVAEQSPAAGSTAKAGDTVEYHLSSGPGDVVIPNVVGDSYESAASRLGDDFEVSVSYVYSDDVEAGYVVSTSPSVGSAVAKGSKVTLNISNGPEIQTVSVPYVIGMSYSNAVSALEAKGFSVTLTSTSSSDSNAVVTGQTPQGTAEEGSTITLSTQASSNTGNGTSSNTSTNSGSGSNTGSNTSSNSGTNSTNTTTTDTTTTDTTTTTTTQ